MNLQLCAREPGAQQGFNMIGWLLGTEIQTTKKGSIDLLYVVANNTKQYTKQKKVQNTTKLSRNATEIQPTTKKSCYGIGG